MSHTWAFMLDGNAQYQLIFYNVLHKYEACYTLPLEWIPEIEKMNRPLYDLIMHMLGKVALAWNLDVIFNTYNQHLIEDPHAALTGEPEEDEMFLQSIAAYKKKGQAFKFRQLIKSYDWMSIKVLEAKIKNAKATDELGTKILAWLESGIKVLEDHGNIMDFVSREVMDYNSDGDPLNANDQFNFAWSFQDLVWKHTESLMNDVAGYGSGVVGPVISEVFTPRKGEMNRTNGAQIDKLATFMELGRDIYFDHFEKHFENKYSIENYEQTLAHILQ